jgi:hypothetical protein
MIGKRSGAVPAAIIIPETDAIEPRQALCCSDPNKATAVLHNTVDIIITKSIYSGIVLEE